MPYPQQPPHPHYYPQQPMHPSHGPPPPQPHPQHGPPPPHHQQHIMPPGHPQQPHQGPPPPPGYYHQPMQHPSYSQPPPPHGPQQSMPPPNPYIQYSHPHPHYYQQSMQPGPPPPHGPPGPHPHSGQPPPHHQQHMLPPGQQPHQPNYYHQPMQHPAYGQPPPHGPQQPMPPPSPYIQYSQPHPHYYQQPMQPVASPHGPPQVPHPHAGPPPPHHQQHMMPPNQQQHQPNYYHQPMQHPVYSPMPHPHGPHPPQTHPAQAPGPGVAPQIPPPPPPHQSPHPNLSLPPPPPSPHHPLSRAHTPQHPPGSQTPTKIMPPLSSTPASPSTIIKAEKKEIIFPKNSVEATKPSTIRRRKFTSKDVTDIEVWRLLMCLKSGLLAESSWAIDVLGILLNDDSTSQFFGLQHMPGMLEAVLEHFKSCLGQLFEDMKIKDTTLKPELGKPVTFSHWQEGNGEDTSHIQVYFDPDNFIETSRRCICISTILRNLSFIPGNDVEMSRHAGLLLILGRILMYRPDDDVYNEFDSAPNEWHLISSLREDTLVIISNISSSLDLSPYNDKINLDLLRGLLHWACCSSTYALDPFPPPSMVSPQRLALESLAKLSIIEGNVDLILATPPWTRIEKLFEVLTNMLNMNEDQTIREFSLVLLSNLAAADSGIARKVALTGNAIARLVSFLETSIADPEVYTTTQDMLRRAALTLKCLSQLVDNHSLFAHQQQRLLNLVMSKRLDQEVAPIIADVIFEISLSSVY